jgi:hypothetical protein
MKHAQRLVIASAMCAGIAAIVLHAQNLPPNFGTPQGTNALATSAGFIDILGIKLGMPAEQALATLKGNYPASKITLERTRDYESAWYNLERDNPSHQWVFRIDVDSNGIGDKISIGLSLPPNKQVVHAISRETFLKEPVAVENIVAGLRKKYGQETYGVDYRMGESLTIFDGAAKNLLWIYDAQGSRVKPAAVTKNAQMCLVSGTGDMGAAQLTVTNGRPYQPDTLSNNPCMSLVVLNVSIQTVSPTQGITGQARSFQVTAYDWPLITSGANALYTFLDQGARDLAAKQAADAKKRGGDVKY